MIWIALLFLLVALCAVFPGDPRRVPFVLIGSYFMTSLTGQLFALPLAISSLVLAVFAEDNPALVFAAAAVLFGWAHWRNRRAGRVLLDTVELSDFRIPLLAGLMPVMMGQSKSRRIKNISYGDAGKRNFLDVVVPRAPVAGPMPILIHVHGGGWILGNKNQQAKPLLNHLAGNGWLCVDATYRLGPKDRGPAMIVDVLKTIAWVKEHAHEHGGDPSRIAITGGSAGGHLTALAALAHDDRAFKPGFEEVDCSVAMALPMYGRYDFPDRHNTWEGNRKAFIDAFISKMVMPGSPDACPELWDAMSPLERVRADAPPMLVTAGTGDTIVPLQDPRNFVAALRRTASAPVKFAELPGIQHAFDVASSALAWAHVRALEAFLAPLANVDPLATQPLDVTRGEPELVPA